MGNVPLKRGFRTFTAFPFKAGIRWKVCGKAGGGGVEDWTRTGMHAVERLEKWLELTGNCIINYHHLITRVSKPYVY